LTQRELRGVGHDGGSAQLRLRGQLAQYIGSRVGCHGFLQSGYKVDTCGRDKTSEVIGRITSLTGQGRRTVKGNQSVSCVHQHRFECGAYAVAKQQQSRRCVQGLE
jgi:hypothetical protein